MLFSKNLGGSNISLLIFKKSGGKSSPRGWGECLPRFPLNVAMLCKLIHSN